jgi:hypothetical protein
MTRRKTGRRRGRPRLLHARRRQTTRAGRRGVIVHDSGTSELQAHRVSATGSADLPVDPLGILYGRGLIDKDHYLAGRDLGDLLEVARRDLGRSSPQVSWMAIFGARGIGPSEDRGAEFARRVLERLSGRLAPELVALTFAVAEGQWLPFLYVVLAGGARPVTVRRLRRGLDQVARSWSKNRGVEQSLDERAALPNIVHA